jgi:hypothetical protein
MADKTLLKTGLVAPLIINVLKRSGRRAHKPTADYTISKKPHGNKSVPARYDHNRKSTVERIIDWLEFV